MVKKHKYAGFWFRFIAYIIDAAVLAVIGSGISVLLFLMNTSDSFTSLFVLAITWLYFAFMESSQYQGTLGKLAVGLAVTDMKGKRITFANATGRHFGKYISIFILGIGLLMIAFTKQKQGLHDIFAGCLVLRKD